MGRGEGEGEWKKQGVIDGKRRQVRTSPVISTTREIIDTRVKHVDIFGCIGCPKINARFAAIFALNWQRRTI